MRAASVLHNTARTRTVTAMPFDGVWLFGNSGLGRIAIDLLNSLSGIIKEHQVFKFLKHRWKQFRASSDPNELLVRLSIQNEPTQLKVRTELKHHINYHQLLCPVCSSVEQQTP